MRSSSDYLRGSNKNVFEVFRGSKYNRAVLSHPRWTNPGNTVALLPAEHLTGAAVAALEGGRRVEAFPLDHLENDDFTSKANTAFESAFKKGIFQVRKPTQYEAPAYMIQIAGRPEGGAGSTNCFPSSTNIACQ